VARFYQPKETQGIYEAGANRLTINQGDRAFIGFRAISLKEYEETSVDASENVVTARYAIDSTAVELEIDTGKPLTFIVTATQDVAMSAVPKNMTRPLEAVIRKPAYLTAPAVGQGRDPAGCWAACLSYYLSATPNRQARRFIDIVGDFNGLWDANGFIRVDGLRQQIAIQTPRYRMATDRITPGRLPEFLGRWPLLVGFRHPGGFGHMNVLAAYDEQGDLARAMDPFFPDPPQNSITRVSGQVVFNGNEGDFQFTGGFIYRSLSYFQTAMRSGTIFVGYPQEYRNRMP
jgi:hypothetical protein